MASDGSESLEDTQLREKGGSACAYAELARRCILKQAAPGEQAHCAYVVGATGDSRDCGADVLVDEGGVPHVQAEQECLRCEGVEIEGAARLLAVMMKGQEE